MQICQIYNHICIIVHLLFTLKWLFHIQIATYIKRGLVSLYTFLFYYITKYIQKYKENGIHTLICFWKFVCTFAVFIFNRIVAIHIFEACGLPSHFRFPILFAFVTYKHRIYLYNICIYFSNYVFICFFLRLAGRGGGGWAESIARLWLLS